MDVTIEPETRYGDVRARAPSDGKDMTCGRSWAGGVEEKARAQPGNELELSGMDFQKEATAIVASAGGVANNSYSSLYTRFSTKCYTSR